MKKDIVWFPTQASTTATAVDQLFLALVLICGAVGLMVAVLIIYFSIRYRRRTSTLPPAEMRGNLHLEIFWSATPLVIFLGIFVWGAIVYFDAFRAPDHAPVVYGVGKQWMWKFQHPEGQREINELHVPVGQPCKLLLTSEDVIHSFFVPAFRVHMDVLPGRYTTVWFHPTEVGTYHLFCSQYCGTSHADMKGRIVVMEPSDYQRWLNESAEGSLALQGRKTFLKYRCISCHSADADARAPVLEELYGKRVQLRDGRSVIADEDYLRESIMTPGAKVVMGWENIMPTFQGQVDQEDVNQLVAYIKSLKKGQTPRRFEESVPPARTPIIEEEK
ncbi:MAG TPA: cytochrome c oxidase subunit II [Gemmataceae bacterium]|nr:cytochrome c oxidase subunit II [Gemmataceae bacterium]